MRPGNLGIKSHGHLGLSDCKAEARDVHACSGADGFQLGALEAGLEGVAIVSRRAGTLLVLSPIKSATYATFSKIIVIENTGGVPPPLARIATKTAGAATTARFHARAPHRVGKNARYFGRRKDKRLHLLRPDNSDPLPPAHVTCVT